MKINQNKKENWKQYVTVGVFVIMIHWFILLLAYFIMSASSSQELEGFFTYVYARFEQAGDIPHYVEIAKNWYQAVGENANNIVFYPLFPLLMKAMHFVIRDYVMSGIVISNICLVIGGVYFFKLLNFEFNREKAWEGLLLLSVFPVGVFMIGAYTESLFIMLTVMCLYYLRKEKWLLAGILGMLAAFSRTQGIVLFVPAVYEICILFRQREKRTAKCFWAGLIPVGTFGYLLMNQIIYGKWNAFLEFQAAEPWYNTSHWISENLEQHFNMAIKYPYLGVIIYWAQIFLYFAALAVFFYGFMKKIRSSYIVFGGAYIFLSYLHGWLISGPRYVMSCLSIYIILAGTDNKILKRVILVFTAVLSVFFTVWYLQGQAIM